jgi:NADPH:quinone reductase-like Zn-dependent oxidoreductase
MQKVVVHRPGSFDRLIVENCPDPVPGPGEACVSTRAIGVNFADCIVRMGLYESATKYVGWPITPGFEFSGVVSQLGEGVSQVKLGDAVFGVTRFGGYASAVCVPERQLFLLPKSLTFAQAATFPVVFLTAWYALTEQAQLRPGMHVLVHSAAGGVGSAAVQLAKNAGCHVVGVVGSPHKLEHVRGLGISDVIDKSGEDLWKAAERYAPEGYHVVLEANGIETLRESYRHLCPTGRLVIYGFQTLLSRGSGRRNWPKLAWNVLRLPRFNPLAMTNENRGVLAFNLSYLFSETELMVRALSGLVLGFSTGQLRAPPVTEFAFERVADAHRALQSGTTVGKLALVP